MEITVKELREMLEKYDDNLLLDFGGLNFYRLKDRGGDVQFEFNQTIRRDDQGNVIVENH